uniref:ATPase subunit 4 n=1 Tax=Micromonas pusilla (strain CCMP1545) TaxID=564608 RepID=C1KR94_MICPC|nr:ATPase subunit 4 [Micromonas pusilla CCMP1545]|tara:strand:- start:444 stop:1184 length:741 start_codon:yes stop_codon:yes gene_type:complete|eukprot:29642-Pelagococcus_subviridis.AAC.5
MPSNFMVVLGSFLGLVVLSSKNLLIYNEELLILICFVLFVVTSYQTMGDAFSEAFAARKALIEQELRRSHTLQVEALRAQAKVHEDHQNLPFLVNTLGSLVDARLKTLCGLHTHMVKSKANETLVNALTLMERTEASRETTTHRKLQSGSSSLFLASMECIPSMGAQCLEASMKTFDSQKKVASLSTPEVPTPVTQAKPKKPSSKKTQAPKKASSSKTKEIPKAKVISPKKASSSSPSKETKKVKK